MRLSNSYFYTLREDSSNEDTRSGNLLVRSGMIKKVGNGIYMFMPMGLRVLNNIENIIRDEMSKIGAQEVVMPSLIPEDYYVNSGRKDVFGDDMFSLKDRYDRDFVLGPTHEELFVYAAKEMVKSYKNMPFNIYQIANKYRDEPRPRFGLIRTREFIMQDAYTFDIDDEACHESYMKNFNAYKNIFDRVGLDYKIVRASTGAMGGELSEEFQAVSSIGEDTLVLCDNCDYASNEEVSECICSNIVSDEETFNKELIYTPGVGTIEEVSKFLNFDSSRFVKTLIYKADEKIVACLIPGNRELNEHKLSILLNAKSVSLADEDTVMKVTHANIGFAGPIDIDIDIIMDNHVKYMKNFVVGANKTDYHYKNVNISDFDTFISGDIVNVIEGDICPKCKSKLVFKKGIECGNTFKLGTKYSSKLGLNYLDKDNKLKPVVMGCYGIGVARTMTSVAEQTLDEYGLSWPSSIAPYKVCIVLINNKDEKAVRLADKIYEELNNNNIEALYDDRCERAGVKFKDMELIGIPVQITVGKDAINDMVEIKRRRKDNTLVKYESVIDKVKELL